MGDGVARERAVDGVEISCAKRSPVHGMVGVAGGACAVGHLAETTVNGIVSKADIGGGFLGVCVSDPGELAVFVVGVGFDLSLGVGEGVEASG